MVLRSNLEGGKGYKKDKAERWVHSHKVGLGDPPGRLLVLALKALHPRKPLDPGQTWTADYPRPSFSTRGHLLVPLFLTPYATVHLPA